MNDYALDSDIVSFILRKQGRAHVRYKAAAAQGSTIYIPPYVYYEVRRWLTLKNAAVQQAAFDSLYEDTGIPPISQGELDRAISIYVDLTRRGVVIDDGDILIAANLNLVRRLAPHT
jgi:tRNA(fMet)-specific endonuclease VapC